MDDPRLYILMRTDMASLNAGKGMAQAAHAANAFVKDITRGNAIDTYNKWCNQTSQGFGTTIVLAVDSEQEMVNVVTTANQFGYFSNTVLDPTYPIRDGKVTHVLPVHTCAYIYAPSRQPEFLSGFALHP